MNNIMVEMKKLIMVVDDEPDIVDLLTIILESENYDVIQAFNGKECLKKLKEKIPDLILLDVMMKPMDGWETLKVIKTDKNFKSIPVAMLTAKKISEETLNNEFIDNIENYIQKPFNKKDLLQKIKKLLKRNDKVLNTAKKLESEIGSFIAEEYEDLAKRIIRHKSLLNAIEKLSYLEEKEREKIDVMKQMEEKLITILEKKLDTIESQVKNGD